ncbi:MAG TPA: FAD-dependent oxidoreductase [Candidatus Yaniella excrementigallinarum]|nr:FAD-dependent oxidoreductase [Candidatus Yaniella excrementigallinarum]
MSENVIIIGAGQAGLTAATSLRDQGFTGQIHLISDEEDTPYQRPPLSKGYLAGTETTADLALCTVETLKAQEITTYFGASAKNIDRAKQAVALDNGLVLEYEWLIFATGSSPRSLQMPGSTLAGIHAVRTVEDSDRLRASFSNGGNTIFIGGGFLNLEVAVEAARHGKATVLEVSSQILGRVLSRPAADALEQYHRSLGVDICCGVSVEEIIGEDGHVVGVRLDDGDVIAADRVVVAIGAIACDELANMAGLETAGGIVVDEQLRTNDAHIFAIGDCAIYPNVFSGTQMRVESVQNATDQARYVAQLIVDGGTEHYQAVPWFWSTQGERKLQIAGLALPDDEALIVDVHEDKGKLVVERLRQGQVVAVETINAPGPHMKARRRLAQTVLHSDLAVSP